MASFYDALQFTSDLLSFAWQNESDTESPNSNNAESLEEKPGDVSGENAGSDNENGEKNTVVETVEQGNLSDKGACPGSENKTAVEAVEQGKGEYLISERNTAAEVVRFIQGGLLCRGVFLSKHFEELEAERDPVIDVNQDIDFKGAQSTQETFHRVFQSEQIMEIFDQTIDRNKMSMSGSGGVAVWGIKVDLQGAKSKDAEKKTEKTDKATQNYISSAHYEVVPVKSIHLTMKNVDLKLEAISALQEIENRISKTNYKSSDAFSKFFKRFGSHVHQGVIDFGGILMSTASVVNFGDSKHSEVKDMATAMSEASLNAEFSQSPANFKGSIPFKMSEIHSSPSWKCNDEELKEVSVVTKKIGGPIDVDDKSEWRKALTKSSNVWRIINRSCTPKPIWEFLDKYPDKFQNCFLLACAMEEDWQNETDITISCHPLDRLRREIRMWIELYRDQVLKARCLEELSNIRHKHKIMDEDWRDEAIYSPEVQIILSRTAFELESERDQAEVRRIITSFKDILHPISRLKKQRFPKVQAILDNIRQVEKFSNENILKVEQIERLGNAIKIRLETIDRANIESHTKLRDLQSRLELTLELWNRKPMSYSFLVCLGVMRLFGFNLKEFKFEYYLLKEDFNQIVKVLEEYLTNTLSFQQCAQKQAFILRLALASPQQKEMGVKLMMHKMPDALDEGLEKAYLDAKNPNGTLDISKFQDKLARVTIRQSSPVDLVAMIHSLKTQLSFNNPSQRTHTKQFPDFEIGNCKKNGFR